MLMLQVYAESLSKQMDALEHLYDVQEWIDGQLDKTHDGQGSAVRKACTCKGCYLLKKADDVKAGILDDAIKSIGDMLTMARNLRQPLLTTKPKMGLKTAVKKISAETQATRDPGQEGDDDS